MTTPNIPINPLMQNLRARIPGESFRLPSQGLYYTNGELNETVSNGEVHVFPMTAYDEITMKTPDKLISGKAIEEVFLRCIPSITNPMDLLTKDVDYLLLCLRLLTFGPELTLRYKHNCENAAEHEYVVNIDHLVRSPVSVDPTTIGIHNVIEMASGQKVTLKPSMFKDVIRMYETVALKKDVQLSENDFIDLQMQLVDIISRMIVDIDGIKDQSQISEWMQNIPSGWVSELSDKAAKMTEWGVDPTVTIMCGDCKEEVKIEVPINPVNFFM